MLTKLGTWSVTGWGGHSYQVCFFVFQGCTWEELQQYLIVIIGRLGGERSINEEGFCAWKKGDLSSDGVMKMEVRTWLRHVCIGNLIRIIV